MEGHGLWYSSSVDLFFVCIGIHVVRLSSRVHFSFVLQFTPLICFRSLESKLESLKAEKGIACELDNDSSQTESPIPFQKSMEVESSRKETSKDGLSAGSFTQDTRTNWSPECQIPAAVSSEDMEAKPEISESSRQEKISSSEKLGETSSGRGGRVRGRRGKRKRKDCTRDVKEGSVGESDFLGSTDVASASQCKEISMGDHGQVVVSSGIDDCNKGCSSREEIDDLMGIFYSIMENENAPVFRGRHDSQVSKKLGAFQFFLAKLVSESYPHYAIRFLVSSF